MSVKVNVTSPCQPYLRPHLHSQPKDKCEAQWHCLKPEDRQKWVEEQAKQVVQTK